MNDPGILTHVDLDGDWKNWPYGLNARWPNFRPHEFRSGDSAEFLISTMLLDGLQLLRRVADTPIYVNRPEQNLLRRGFRTEKDNREAGGKPKSQHLSGRAADCDTAGVLSPGRLAMMATDIECFARGGIIVYNSFAHLDCGYRQHHSGVTR